MLPQLVGFFSGRACMMRTESISVTVMTRTEGISVRVMTRTKGTPVRVMMRTDRSSVRVKKMPPQSVGFLPVERACDSYSRYICKSNKDAASASRLSSGRACMTRTEGISVRVIWMLGGGLFGFRRDGRGFWVHCIQAPCLSCSVPELSLGNQHIQLFFNFVRFPDANVLWKL
jgi:hypothetical protein